MAPEDRRPRVAATLPNPGGGGEALSMTPVYGQTQRARVARPCAHQFADVFWKICFMRRHENKLAGWTGQINPCAPAGGKLQVVLIPALQTNSGQTTVSRSLTQSGPSKWRESPAPTCKCHLPSSLHRGASYRPLPTFSSSNTNFS